MVCDFTGMIDSTGEKDHLITTDDPVMNKILGLSAFTLEDLKIALDTRVPWGQIKNVGNVDDVFKKLMTPDPKELYFEKFNKKTGKYNKVNVYDQFTSMVGVSNPVKNIILLNRSLWDWESSKHYGFTEEAANTLIDSIQASPDGCLTFQSKFLYNFSVEGEVDVLNPGCEKEVTPTFKLYLYDPEYENSGERKLAGEGHPIFASDDTTHPDGFSVGAPKDDLSDGSYSPKAGGNDNKTAAPLRAVYEPNTGEWESGTTNILARLLTDLPAVSVNPIDPGAIDSQKIEEYTDPKSPTFLSPFEPGWALPLSVHKGNPHLFAPTWVNKDCEGEKKHKIRVTNRAGRSFAAGDLVMCFRIGGHWYVMDFGSDVGAAGVFKIGKWSFMNMIAERRAFFRDARYYQDLVKGEVPEAQYSNIVSPDAYESFFRENWFYDMYFGGTAKQPTATSDDLAINDYEEIAAWNVGNGEATYFNSDVGKAARDFHSCLGGYYQQTSFDLLDTQLGGTHHVGNMIGRTHLLHRTDGSQETDVGGEATKGPFFPFWGATFPDGYAAEKISTLRNSSLTIDKYGLPHSFNGIDDLITSGGSVAGMFDLSENKNKHGGIWEHLQDKNGVQLPADVALLASPAGENGYGIESFLLMEKLCSFGGFGGSANHTMFYNLPDQNGFGSKFNWLTMIDGTTGDGSTGGEEGSEKGILPSLYDFKPLSPQRIEFKPLWADYIGSLDKGNENNLRDEDYYNGARLNFESNPDTGSYFEGVIGKAFCDRIYARDFTESVIQNESTGGDGSPTWRGVPYGPLVGGGTIPNQRWGSGPDGGNIVGMTIAKAKINVKATELTFTVTQSLGLGNVMSAAGGGSTEFFWIGGTSFNIYQTGPGAHNNSFPQWGQNTDKPWQGGAFGTTALHGRLCDQWPDEQTLLDPRYFAVMHFNQSSGVYQNNETGAVVFRDAAVDLDETLPTLGVAKAASNGGAGWNPGEKLPDFNHKRGISYSDVDLRVPTLVNDHSTVSTALWGHKFDGDNYLGVGSIFLSPGDWLVNPIRRGQLLPFTYPKTVIRCVINNDPTLSGTKSMGQNFTIGDKLTTSGGHGSGVELEVTSVSAAGATPPGAITGWKFTKDELGNDNFGEGFLPQDFPTEAIHPTADGGQEGSVTLVTKTGSGTGLDYKLERTNPDLTTTWVTRIKECQVIIKKGKDEGPNRGVVIKQLSLTSNPPGGHGDIPGVSAGQAKNGISLDAAHDGEYDLFLLFHADVQHYLRGNLTFSNDGAQYCTLEISTAN